MEETWFLIVSATSVLFLSLVIWKHFLQNKNLPPSPFSFPIIGHLHLIKEPIHRTLCNLSDKFGPIMNLQLGNRTVLLLSSPSAVRDCFSKHDLLFANRPHLLAGKYLNYNFTTMGASDYGPHWRNLRRISTLEIFSTERLNTFIGIRQDEVRLLLKKLYQSSQHNFTQVEMKSKLSELSFNVIMRMVAGKRYFGGGVEDSEEAKQFRDIIREIFDLSAASSPTDFLPFLRLVDYQSIEQRMIVLGKKTDVFMQSLIDEHRSKKNSAAGDTDGSRRKTKTMIDSMLALQESEPENYTDEIIKGLILILLAAGTDTSSGTIEWAMSLLLNNPDVLKKARAELDKYVGHERLANESDFPKLHYLQSIINETLRLFPAAPLLGAHQSSDDCTIEGYHVSRNTMLMVNAWAIHRDPKVWEDPTSFKPERFEGWKGDQAYRFIPFGIGRRACPGAGLANRVMGLSLAALVQCFEWERVSEEEVDMAEGTGLTMPKAMPLEAMCKARESMFNVLSEL